MSKLTAGGPGVELPAAGSAARVVAVASAKGDVGKTSLATNLAISLAQRGARVCVVAAESQAVDGSAPFAIQDDQALSRGSQSERLLAGIILHQDAGVDVISLSCRRAQYAGLDSGQRRDFLARVQQLERRYDYLLIDTTVAGGEDMVEWARAAQYVLLVITPEVSSWRDVCGLTDERSANRTVPPRLVVVNRAAGSRSSFGVFERCRRALQSHDQLSLDYLGYVPVDDAIMASVFRRHPAVLAQPDAPASRAFRGLARALEGYCADNPRPSAFAMFWQRLLDGCGGAPMPSAESVQAAAELEATAERILEWLRDDAVSSEQAQQLLGRLTDAFVERFGRMPGDDIGSLQLTPAPRDYPKAGTRELVQQMGALVERHPGRPLGDVGTAPTALPDMRAAMRYAALADVLPNSFHTIAQRLALQQQRLQQRFQRLQEAMDERLSTSDQSLRAARVGSLDIGHGADLRRLRLRWTLASR